MSYSKIFLYILFVLILIMIFIFFITVSPIIPYNADDWRYLSQYRSPLPSLNEWNPARVFPEIVYPLLGYVSSYFVYFTCGDYIESISLTFSFFLSLFIMFLCIAIYKFFNKYSRSKKTAIFSMFLFITFSFFMFKSKNSENLYLFYSASLTHLIYYSTANILNSIIYIYILNYNFFNSYTFKNKYYLYGIILLIIYFSQFSLTFASIITASCALSVILLRIWHEQSHGILKKSVSYLRNLSPFDGILFFTLVCWISAASLDMLGARYAALSPHQFNFSAAFSSFYELLYSMRKEMQIITFISIFFTTFLLMYRKLKRNFSNIDNVTFEVIFIVCISTIISFSLYMLIGAKTHPEYVSSISVMYGVFFFQILLTVFCITYLLTEIPFLKIFAPFLLCFLFIAITNSEKTWAVPSTPVQRSIVESWIVDAKRADAAGEKNVTITVPKAEWPHPKEWFGDVLGHTLYTHGITSHRLHIKIKEGGPTP